MLPMFALGPEGFGVEVAVCVDHVWLGFWDRDSREDAR